MASLTIVVKNCVELSEEDTKALKLDIMDLESSKKYLELVIEKLNEVDDFDDDRYEKLQEILQYIDDLRLEKQIELEMGLELNAD